MQRQREEERTAAVQHQLQWRRLTFQGPCPTPGPPPPSATVRKEVSVVQQRSGVASVLEALLRAEAARHDACPGTGTGAPACTTTEDATAVTEQFKESERRWPIYRRLRAERERREFGRQHWNPHTDTTIRSAPGTTVVVARISRNTTEEALRRHCAQWGRVKSVRIVKVEPRHLLESSEASGEAAEMWYTKRHCKGSEGESRGYGFVEYAYANERENAVKYGNGSVLDGRTLAIEEERGRANVSFLPKRLGGGSQLALERIEQKRLERRKRARSPPTA